MRTMLTICFILAGCGGDHHDAADLAAPAPPPDMASSACDFLRQSGCPTGDKCVPAGSADEPQAHGRCIPVSGAVAVDSPGCSVRTDFADECVAGAICTDNGPGSHAACRRICASDGDCAGAAQKCLLFFDSAAFGLCMPTCTPTIPSGASSDCPAGSDCAASWPDIGPADATYFICKLTGSGTLNGFCMADRDCGAGLFCDGFSGCSGLCDPSHACAPAPAGVDGGTTTCTEFANLTPPAGVCL